ncbi:hypothetical protein PR048_033157 [Dryococelus australis]|uniref:Uncharacterized protein n=1 Tax=Dryococelus australis TaxID=614101 RepID=A0ABQ9G0Q0_9NEOP|nr:hypothetical protein PR048_033157 [Dryococelus australis]
MQVLEKREIPERTRRPAASSSTIPTCENSGASPSRVKPASDVHSLAATPQSSLCYLTPGSMALPYKSAIGSESSREWLVLPRTWQYGIRNVFLCKPTISTETPKACPMNCDQIAKGAARISTPPPPRPFSTMATPSNDCVQVIESCDRRQLRVTDDATSGTMAASFIFKDEEILKLAFSRTRLERSPECVKSVASKDLTGAEGTVALGESSQSYYQATPAERLACSPPTKEKPGSIPGRVTRFFHAGVVPDDIAGRRVFSGSPVSPVLSFRRRSILASITLIGSQDLDVKSRPNLYTQF